MNTITTATIPPMTPPTITGVDESEEEMLTWMGDAMLVAFSIGISGVTPLVAVTVMVYCAPGFRPAWKLLQTCIGLGRMEWLTQEKSAILRFSLQRGKVLKIFTKVLKIFTEVLKVWALK